MSDPDTGRVPWRSRSLYVILATTFFGVTGIPLVGPTLPSVAAVFDVSDVRAGLLITLYSLPIIVFAPVLGIYADRIGRKQILVPCLVLFGIAGGLIGFVDRFYVVLLLRFVQGSAGAGLLTVSFTLIGDLYEGAQRNAVMGINGVAIAAGASLAPVLSGWFVSIEWNAPFLFYFSAAALGPVAAIVLSDPEIEGHDGGRGYLREAAAALPVRDALLLYGAVFLMFGLLLGGINTVIPLVLDRAYAVPSSRIGVILALSPAAAVITSSQNGRFASRMPNKAIVVSGLTLLAVATLGIGLVDSTLFIGGAVALFGLGKGLTQPSLDTAISDMVPAQFRGGAMSLRTTTKNLSGTVWPVMLTSAGAVMAYTQLFLLLGVALALFTVAVALHFR